MKITTFVVNFAEFLNVLLLVNCEFARTQGRYTWRHDSALQHIEKTLGEQVLVVNSRKPTVFAEVARRDFHASFVRAGEKRKGPTPAGCKRNLLEDANDWKLLVDYEQNDHFSSVHCSPPCVLMLFSGQLVLVW